MINEKCFTKERINEFRKQKEYRKINPPVLEKMINALYLLQLLSKSEIKFTFKGGTSLILLLNKARRFSVDIDILTLESREVIEKALTSIVDDSHFSSWELDKKRSYNSGVPKAHYELFYDSELQKGPGYIILDILFEESIYPKTQESEIKSEWIESTEVITVTTPTIESILGDKLTAFAPTTTGIMYGKGKGQEIIKQLFDVSCLYDEVENITDVFDSFHTTVQKELMYRNLEISEEKVLDDIINTSILIAKREKNKLPQEKIYFKELQQGIKQFGSFLIEGSFTIEDAIIASAKSAILANRLKKNDHSKLPVHINQDVTKLSIEGDLSFLNKLKKLKDKSAFFYWWNVINEL